MRKILTAFFIVCLFSVNTSFATDDFDFNKAGEGISRRASESIAYSSEEFSFYDTAEKIKKGEFETDIKSIMSGIIGMLFSEVRANVKTMGVVMLLGILCSFLSNLASSFNTGVSDASFLCCYALLAGVSSAGFYEISECAKGAMEDMGLFIKTLIPFMTALSASEGRVVFASLLHTEILTAAAISTVIMEKAVMPLLYASFALKFINNMTKTMSLTNLSKMADKTLRRILGFTFLIYTAVLSLSGFAAGTVENIGLKTARFAVSSFVPVAGGTLADSVSAITASFALIKNSAGIAGIIAIILIAAYPVIKCAAVSFIYNFAGAVLEPVCDSRLSGAVSSVGEIMGMLFGIVSVTAAQYVISAAILLTAYRG